MSWCCTFLTANYTCICCFHRFSDDRLSAQKALQTVAAGQQAENLLDFDDQPATEGQPSGLAATQVLSTTPAAANLLSGTSSNPLDDLVSIFGNVGGGGGAGMGGDELGGLSFGGGLPIAQAPPSAATDLGILGASAATSPVQSPPTRQQPQEDLLGLF